MSRFQTTSKQKCSNLGPLLFITFPQGIRISKNIGHPTFGSGGKKTFKRYLKSEHTDGQTHGQTDRRTFQLIESIGPEARCFEKGEIFTLYTLGFLDHLHFFALMKLPRGQSIERQVILCDSL